MDFAQKQFEPVVDGWKQLSMEQKLAISFVGVSTFAYGTYKYLTNPPANTSELLDIECFPPSKEEFKDSESPSNIWTRDYLVKYAGTTVYSTCTIIKLSTKNDICIHSPCKCDNIIRQWINKNNFNVSYIIAPGNYHYFNALEWSKTFSNAKMLICPGIEIKRPNLRIDGFLFDNFNDDLFEKDFDQILIRGFSEMWETVLYHKRSRTLILVDIVENIGDNTKGVNRMLKLFWKCMTFMWNNPKPAPEYSWFVKNKQSVQNSLNKILYHDSWPYTQIILSHGEHFIPKGKDIKEKHEKCVTFLENAWKQFV